MKAYPHAKFFSDTHSNDHMNGMDLEDFFAAHAMQALLRMDPDKFFQLYQDKYVTMLEGVADIAFHMSEEMMKRRSK